MAYTASAPAVTALDGVLTPVNQPTSGAGVAGEDKDVSDFVAVTTGNLGSTASKFQLIRLPVNAKVKYLTLSSDVALDSSTGLKFDVGAYYSDSTTDGTPAALRGTAISVNCFAAALTFQATFQNVWALAQFSVAKRNQPLWQALGLASNPGGFIDIVVAVNVVATTAVASNLGLDAEYVH